MAHSDPRPSTKESAATPVSPPRPPRWLREEPTKMQARSKWRTAEIMNQTHLCSQGVTEARWRCPTEKNGTKRACDWFSSSFLFFSVFLFFCLSVTSCYGCRRFQPIFSPGKKLLQPNSCRKKSENTPFKPRGLGIKRKRGKRKASKGPLSKKVYRT